MSELRPRSAASRALALLLLAALPALLWLGVIDPLARRYQENHEALAEGAHLLSGLKSAIAAGRRASADEDARELDRYRGDFLAGVEDAIIAADLQTRVSRLTTARKAEVTSARALPPKTRDGLVYLGLRLSIRGGMKSLQQVLHAFESGTPLLFVERAVLRRDDRAAGGRTESLAPMTLDVDIYGAKWPDLAPGGTQAR